MRLRVAKKISYTVGFIKPQRRCLAYLIKDRHRWRSRWRHKNPDLWEQWCKLRQYHRCYCGRHCQPPKLQ